MRTPKYQVGDIVQFVEQYNDPYNDRHWKVAVVAGVCYRDHPKWLGGNYPQGRSVEVVYELWRPGPEIQPIMRRSSVSEEALAGLCAKESAVGAMKAWYMGLHLDGRL